MNGRRARQLRKLVDCDLGRDTENKDQGTVVTGSKTIGQIQPDGNHTSRDEDIVEVRTVEDRYLYRQLKKVYSRSKPDEEVRDNIVTDLQTIEDIKDRTDEELTEYVFENPSEELGKD